MMGLETSRIDVKSLGRVWGPTGGCWVSWKSPDTISRGLTAILLVPRFVIETGYQQVSCTVFRTSLGFSRRALKSL